MPSPAIKIALSTLLLLALPFLAPPARAQDHGVLKFDESSFEVLESAGVAVITVERSQGEDGSVTVQYSATAGSAGAGSDFTPVSGTLSWGSGDGSNRTFNVPIIDDSAAEGAETIQLTLGNPTGGATLDADRSTSVVVILANDGGSGGGGGDDDGTDDDDPDDGDDDRPGTFKFDDNNFYVLESAGMAVISVERSRGEAGAVSVHYSTADGTAMAGSDYTEATGVLSWGPGDESRKTFAVPIRNDSRDEPDETVLLTLFDPAGGAAVDAERGMAVLTIRESPGEDAGGGGGSSPGFFKFDERGFQAFEGTGTARIAVERSGGERGAASVRYATADGSAMAGADYDAVSGTLSWAAGEEGTKTFTVPVRQDSLSEGNETVRLVLSDATGGAGLDTERRVADLTILDDDGATGACIDDGNTLCLTGGRFRVEVVWRSPQGLANRGQVIRSTDSSGLVWFFSPDNVEMLIKVLDACPAPELDTYWVFFAATTNVSFTVTVTDTHTGLVKEYTNALGQPAEPVQDTFTFPCS